MMCLALLSLAIGAGAASPGPASSARPVRSTEHAPAMPRVPADRLKDAHPLLPVLCDTMRGVLAVLDPPARPAGLPDTDKEPGKSSSKDPIRPSLITYQLGDARSWNVSASFGAIDEVSQARDVHVTVRMRVGDRMLDNTHHVPNDRSEGARIQGASGTVSLPLEANPAVIRRILEDETDRRFARAVSDLGAVKAARAMASAPEDRSPDLSFEEPQVSIVALNEVSFDPTPWEDRLRRASGEFLKTPTLLGGDAWLRLSDDVRLVVTSEGTVIQQRVTRAFVGLRAWTRTDDGEDLGLQWDAFFPDPKSLPGDAEILAHAADLAARVESQRKAQAAEPYVGPMIITGRAAGVMFHEVLGHPLEGERQRAEDQSQTFKGKIGESILPEFLSITFDPTMTTLGGVPLGGAYDFDDEGVKARPVVAVDKGVLRSFLLSRRPVAGFPSSNGHGRTSGAYLPMARQSNLLVNASTVLSEAALRAKLIELAKAKGLGYGLSVTEVERGATRTSRGEPNAFNVVPVEVFRVYVDGRPDELIRGAELVGTPLAALQKIAAAGDRVSTFNGICGAESGWVPVSASSPALLLAEIEVQRAAKASERLPILPPPDAPGASR